jgi:2-dehydro-3-deoxyphosphogluconate aldolase/(4S)-4-hydroxy-2-oxoglutarate aldolase
MTETLKIIESAKLLPVVVIKQIEETETVLSGLYDGGLPIAEITFRTECAADAIKLASKNYPQMLIGAGTVINSEQCQNALSCGAKFIVSPGFAPDVAKVCEKVGIPYFPGCVTPTEIINALNYNINIIKFFPAQIFGGLGAVNALGAAFPQVKFIPTGGVDNENLAEFIKSPKIFACGGSWLVKGGYGDIVSRVKQAVKIVKGE